MSSNNTAHKVANSEIVNLDKMPESVKNPDEQETCEC